MREVYIGNGKTVTVDDKTGYGYFLDIDKLEKIVEENQGKEIVCGADGDWFWTAQDISKEDIKQIKEYKKYILRFSCWSKFSVEVDGEREDVTVQVEERYYKYAGQHGFQTGLDKIHFWVRDMYFDMEKLDYPKIKEFGDEVRSLLDKYIKENQ